MFNYTPPPYSLRAEGLCGETVGASGRMLFLQTKAALVSPSPPDTALLRALLPAREALEVRGMGFNQLLQRDLDDHRIVTELIPYLLESPVGPAFFPPVVAMLLPFEATGQPLDFFPTPGEQIQEDGEYPGMRFRTVSHDRAFRSQRLLAGAPGAEVDSPLPFAVLRWNPDAAKLVIMDGQHRAMALLAIERTINNAWAQSPKGARYEPFYRRRVEELLRRAEEQGRPVRLDRIELPVTLCWLPEEAGTVPRPRPHLAARKLFVDVNKNAKPPSEARLVLLSDTELDNLFARELLNRLRTPDWQDRFPLYAVEYDNPHRRNTTPRRWSALTNLEILKMAAFRVVFGPPVLLRNMAASLTGRPNAGEMDEFMREQLRTGDFLPKHFDDGPRRMESARLGRENFPVYDPGKREALITAFFERWGRGVLHLLSTVLPYAEHLRAIRDRHAAWTPGDNIATLAHDALFEGVGMYWTLEEGHALWVEQRQDTLRGTPAPEQPDVSRAWVMLEREQRELFQRRRASLYFQVATPDADTVAASDRLYEALNTYAAQVGLALAWASLHQLHPDLEPTALAEALAAAINDTLTTGPVASRDRRRILLHVNAGERHSLNRLPKLDTPYATHFRYFWLELILAPGADGHTLLHAEKLTAAGLDLAAAGRLRDDARAAYLRLLVVELARDLSRTVPAIRDLPESQRKATSEIQARTQILNDLTGAWKHWFGVPKELALALLSKAFTPGAPAATVVPAVETGTEGHESDAETANLSPTTTTDGDYPSSDEGLDPNGAASS